MRNARNAEGWKVQGSMKTFLITFVLRKHLLTFLSLCGNSYILQGSENVSRTFPEVYCNTFIRFCINLLLLLQRQGHSGWEHHEQQLVRLLLLHLQLVRLLGQVQGEHLDGDCGIPGIKTLNFGFFLKVLKVEG